MKFLRQKNKMTRTSLLTKGLVALCLAMPIGCDSSGVHNLPEKNEPQLTSVKGLITGHKYVYAENINRLSFVITKGNIKGNINDLCYINKTDNYFTKYVNIDALIDSAQNQKEEVEVEGIQDGRGVIVKKLNILGYNYEF